MIYDPKSPLDVQKALTKFDKLINGKVPFEIIEKKEKKNLTEEQQRTLRQNSTVHLWFSVFADEIGCTHDECKRDVKRKLLGRKPVVNVITGETDWEDYKTSEMSVAELSSFMERFKIWANTDYGCYLPYWGDAGYEEMMREYRNR